jgi:hypothetical protein
MRPFRGHLVRIHVPPPRGVGVEIHSLRALQVSKALDSLDLYFTNIIEAERAHAGPFYATFGLPFQGGQNRKNRDCAGSRRAVVSLFGELILVGIREWLVSFPRRCVHVYRVNGCGRVSLPVLLSLLVRVISSFDTLLAYCLYHLESTEPPTTL